MYRLPNIVRAIESRKLRWTGRVARIEVDRNAFEIWIGEPTGERLLERPMRRWEDNFRMDLKEIGVNMRN